MASISEKLVTVAENTPKVHHAGQLNVVQSAQSLKGSESNTAMLLDDVSPVEHTMGVRVRGKNLIPFPYRDLKLGTSTYNGIDFTVYEDGSILINGTATSNTTRYLYNNTTDLLGLKSGITISANKNVSDNTQQANVYFICNYYNSAATMQMGIQASTNASGTKTITEDWKGLGIYLHIPRGKTLNNLLIKPQLEIGTTPTAYTPYIPDLTAVKVSRYGKNLLNQSNPKIGTLSGSSNTYVRNLEDDTWYLGLTLSGYYDRNGLIDYSINENYITVKTKTSESSSLYGLTKALKCKPNTKYTLSYTMENGKTKNASGIGFYGADKKFISFVYCDSGSSFTTPSNCYWIIVCFHGNTEGTYVTYSNIQLKLGETATDYEPYISSTNYIPNSDGTVEGVTSLYPNTTLMTDTDGIIIDCEYYKDIDKAYNKLSAAIALSGGE